MSYEQLIKKIKDLPEEYFDKVSVYIDSLRDTTLETKKIALKNCAS